MDEPESTTPILPTMPTSLTRSRSAEQLAFGARLRAARLRAELTQAQLAGDRYTKAFVSALENGFSQPSVSALAFFADRLGVRAADLLGETDTRWSRLEADLHLAAGEWQAAADAYETLLETATPGPERAELLRGWAEALASLDRPTEAVAAAAEAAAVFAAHDRGVDAALARYWQAAGLYRLENADEARALLIQLLAEVRGGLRVEPDFELRVLIALAMIDGREGQPERALTYLTEARGRLDELDDRRRASFLESLAISYREAGDYEGAVVLANQALAYFRAASNDLEVANLDNELALTLMALGNLRDAATHAAAARARLASQGVPPLLANVRETEASIALAQGDLEAADAHAIGAVELARSTGNGKALISAELTHGRIALRRGDTAQAEASFEAALSEARERGRTAQVRECLVELGDLAAARGDTARAYELTREALGQALR
jgi:tetratricopeptide (TPR) repeat protein